MLVSSFSSHSGRVPICFYFGSFLDMLSFILVLSINIFSAVHELFNAIIMLIGYTANYIRYLALKQIIVKQMLIALDFRYPQMIKCGLLHWSF